MPRPKSQPKKLRKALKSSGGRMNTISGSRPDDDRVRVMACVAPLPGHRITHDHEAGDLVDDVIHPAGLERGTVATFVPARIRR